MSSSNPVTPSPQTPQTFSCTPGSFVKSADIKIEGAPSDRFDGECQIVGNPEVFKELTKLIPAHGNRPESLKTKTPWDAVKVPVATRTISGLNLDGDSHPDFLIIRSFEIYVAPEEKNKHRTVSFMMTVNGESSTDGKDSPNIETMRRGAVIAVATQNGSAAPIDKVNILNEGGRHKIKFWSRDSRNGKMTEHVANDTPTISPNDQYLRDHALFDAISSVQGYVLNTIGYLESLFGAENKKGSAGYAVSETLPAFVYNQLNLPLLRQEDRRQAIVSDPKLVEYYNGKDPDLLPFMKALGEASKRRLLLSQADGNHIAELSAQSNEKMQAALNNFRWNDKGMTRQEFYAALAQIPDQKVRRELVEKYSGAVLQGHKEGLFPMVGELNAIARKYGFENFAEYVGSVQLGIAPRDFDQMLREYHAANEEKLTGFIDRLRAVNRRLAGSEEVNEWDVDYLTEELIKEKMGGRSTPTITLQDALAVTKRFFRDIGIDMDKPPFAGNITYDVFKRENKYVNFFSTSILDGRRAWLNGDFDPHKEIPFDMLSGVIHEHLHALHTIISSERARGNLGLGMLATTSTWHEGVAMAIDMLTTNKSWMDRYLSDIPQFSDPQLRAMISEVNGEKMIYKHMMVLARARFEINLYQDKDEKGAARPLEERQNFWTKLANEYMHVEAMPGTIGGMIYATPHFATQPGYYVSYEGGLPSGLLATRTIYDAIEAVDAKALKRAGKAFKQLLGLGARATTSAELQSAIHSVVR